MGCLSQLGLAYTKLKRALSPIARSWASLLESKARSPLTAPTTASGSFDSPSSCQIEELREDAEEALVVAEGPGDLLQEVTIISVIFCEKS